MEQIFLVHTGQATENVNISLRKKINLRELCEQNDINLDAVIRKGSVINTRHVNVWGTRESTMNVWRDLNPGDGLFYYCIPKDQDRKHHIFEFYGEAAALADSPELSQAIWNSPEFRYIHICQEVLPIEITKETMWEYFGYKSNYKFRGFNRVAPGRYQTLPLLFDDMDSLSNYLQEIQSLELGAQEILTPLPDNGKKRSDEKMEGLIRSYKEACEKVAAGKIQVPFKEPDTVPGKINKPLNRTGMKGLPNFAKLNSAKETMGMLGEEIALQLEKRRLIQCGRADLAEKVQIVSKKSNQYGYDILSYTLQEEERHVEVKATSKGKNTSFELTFRELDKFKSENNYIIFRIFDLRLNQDSIDYSYYILDCTNRNKIKTEPIVYKVYYEEE